MKALIISDQDGDPVSDQVNQIEPVNRLLLVLGDETLSSTELMIRLDLSHKATFRKNYLNPALTENLTKYRNSSPTLEVGDEFRRREKNKSDKVG